MNINITNSTYIIKIIASIYKYIINQEDRPSHNYYERERERERKIDRMGFNFPVKNILLISRYHEL